MLLATLALGGCRSRPAALDPFLGRTTVAPPPTGAAAVQPGAGLTLPPPGTAPAGAAPAFSAPPAGSAPAGSIYSPPGGFTPNTSPAPRVLSNNGAPPATAPAGQPASPPTQFASTGGSPIRIQDPPPGSAAASAAARPTLSNNSAVDIMSLPVSRRSVSPPTNAAPQPAYPPGVGPATRTTTLPAADAAFGYNPNYSQLAGRLEYSPSDQRWFLRYVAPGNTPDRFGGVAWLAVQHASAGLKNGDFVVADGSFNASGAVNGVPPIFTTTNVVLQRDRR
jgi:hypothetical protein